MRTQYTELKLIEEAIHMAENTLLSIENPSDAVLSALDYLDDVLCGLHSEKLLGAKLAPQKDGSYTDLVWAEKHIKKPPSNCSLKTAHR
ncbi:hypothetical protein [Acetobacterium sp.]|uniref:hypothetical protein n=1 Tax=Acetobacterium sp. TaxID=1872094 RepID=UPI00359371B1